MAGSDLCHRFHAYMSVNAKVSQVSAMFGLCLCRKIWYMALERLQAHMWYGCYNICAIGTNLMDMDCPQDHGSAIQLCRAYADRIKMSRLPRKSTFPKHLSCAMTQRHACVWRHKSAANCSC